MPAFVHSPLLWGLLLVGVPVLIHLINMLRHRRVEWGAMEFLLASQKKHRTWIILRQLLLLLMRMLAIAAVVLMVAKPRPQNWFGRWFGSTGTHHIVLLDDSYSMSDRWAGTSAFAEALGVVKHIQTAAVAQNRPQTFTLLRFSRAAQLELGRQPDLWAERVDTKFAGRLDKILDKMQVSETSAGPTGALEAIGELLGERADERRIVYLVSDFRARQWNDPTDLKKQLARLGEAEAEVHLINCVDRTRENLAITSFWPAGEVQAAGVQFFMEVAVTNHGLTPAKEVGVVLEEPEASGRASAAGRSRPAATIAEIPPGETVRERFPVRLAAAGRHLMIARLKPDAVAVDNARYAAVDLPADVPVLLVDGSPEARDARYVSFALAPGGSVRTGFRPQIETPRYLTLNPLGEFRAVTLLDVDWLDESAIEALEAYVRAGGGVAVFLGQQCGSNSRLINENLYRHGEGFFPLPLMEAEPEILPVSRVERAPDLQVGSHPIFRILAGSRNSFISTVIVQRYLAVPEGWRPEPDSTTRVIARLRNGAPLAVERRYGEGRVVAVLTTAAPVWNNWARNPSFAPAMLDLQSYLAQRPAADVSRPVGSKLELELSEEDYARQVRFSLPGEGPDSEITTTAALTTKGTLAASLLQTERSGIYQAELRRTDGSGELRSYALNVDAEEGKLQALSGPELATRLEGVEYRYAQADAFQYSLADATGGDLGDWFLYLLVVLLIGEQILAWSASYHPPSRPGGASGKGGPR
jgi:hypothetical protein